MSGINTKVKRTIITMAVAIVIVSAIAFVFNNTKNKEVCAPLSKDVASLVKNSKTKEAAKKVNSTNCSKPDPAAFKKLNTEKKLEQLTVSMDVARASYRAGDKDKAKELVNIASSSFESMNQVERDQISGFVTLSSDIAAIREGTY